VREALKSTMVGFRFDWGLKKIQEDCRRKPITPSITNYNSTVQIAKILVLSLDFACRITCKYSRVLPALCLAVVRRVTGRQFYRLNKAGHAARGFTVIAW
jgi:hypothetical protein